MNQGAWYPSQHHMRRVINQHKKSLYLDYAGRDASASPAAGYMALHQAQLERFIRDALKIPHEPTAQLQVVAADNPKAHANAQAQD